MKSIIITKDILIGSIGMTTGAIFFIMSLSIREWHFDRLGASFFPKASAISLFVLSLFIFLNGMSKIKTSAANVLSLKNIQLKYWGQPIIIFALLILYTIGLPILGFIISSISLLFLIYLFIIIKEITFQNVLKGLSISVIGTFCLWYLFTRQLYVILP